jgi:serine/threonine protein kinase
MIFCFLLFCVSALPLHATQQIDHQLYAVKKSKRQFRSKRDRERLIQEVLVMRRLGACQYIPQCYRAWQEDGYFYAQMELCEKGTLKQMVSDMMAHHRDIPDQTIWKITHDVSAALLHVHKNGMVHMDVKPSNILISSSGILKLADFGLATDQGVSGDGNEGDNRYMAPELLQSNERTPALDMFSFGMTLYEICRGIVENLPIEGQVSEPHFLIIKRVKFLTVVGVVGLATGMARPARRPIKPLPCPATAGDCAHGEQADVAPLSKPSKRRGLARDA